MPALVDPPLIAMPSANDRSFSAAVVQCAAFASETPDRSGLSSFAKPPVGRTCSLKRHRQAVCQEIEPARHRLRGQQKAPANRWSGLRRIGHQASLVALLL